jgi:hypothetical protein
MAQLFCLNLWLREKQDNKICTFLPVYGMILEEKLSLWYHYANQKKFTAKVDGNIMITQKGQLSQRSQRILEHLESVWQRQILLSPDVLKRIKYVASLTEEYSTAELREIANEVISSMHMYMLGLIQMFQEKAEEEDISARALNKTLTQVRPITLVVMDNVRTQLTVRSLDDLATLINITTSLQTLSQTDSAEEVHSWLYELPMMYFHQLEECGLISSTSGFQRSYHIIGMGYGMAGTKTFGRRYTSSVLPSSEPRPISTKLSNPNPAAYAV